MKLTVLFVFLFSVISAFAYSPGGVMVCGKKPTLYAFFEGSHPKLYNIKVWKDDKKITQEEYLRKALLRLKSSWPTIFDGVVQIMQKMQVVEVGFVDRSRLPEIPFVKAGCRYEEIASRQYDNKFLFVDMNLFPRLSPMGQAGVLVQEAFFAYMADVEVNPDFARKFVAKVFSDEELNPKLNTEGMTPEQKKTATLKLCTNKLDALGKGTKIYVDAIGLCKKEKDEPAVAAYLRIKKFIQETVDECLSECYWEEARKTCEDFKTMIDKKNVCD